MRTTLSCVTAAAVFAASQSAALADEKTKVQITTSDGAKGASAGCGHFSGVIQFGGPIPRANRRLVVNPGAKGLANVVVYLAAKPKSHKPSKIAKAAMFQIKDSRFEPHVLIVQVGRTLQIVNRDRLAHTAHSYPMANDSFNVLLRGGLQVNLVYRRPEPIPVPVKCDLTRGMLAYHVVLDHPFAAVTDPNGRFLIRNIPAGKHRIVVWHELAGKVRAAGGVVEIKPGKTTRMSATLAPAEFSK